MQTNKKLKVLLATCLLSFVFTGCGNKEEANHTNNTGAVDHANAVYAESNKALDDNPNGWWIVARDETGVRVTNYDTLEIDTDKGVWKSYNRLGRQLEEEMECSYSDGVLSLVADYGFGDEEANYECSKGKLMVDGKLKFEKIKDPMFEDVSTMLSGKWYRNGLKESYLDIQENTYHKFSKEAEEYGNDPNEKGKLYFDQQDYLSPYTGELVARGVISAKTSENMIGDEYVLKQNAQVLMILERVDETCFYVKEDADQKIVDGYNKMLNLLNHQVVGVDDNVRLDFNSVTFNLNEIIDDLGNIENIIEGTWEVKDDQTFTLTFKDGTSEDIAFPKDNKEFTIKKVNKTMRIDDQF